MSIFDDFSKAIGTDGGGGGLLGGISDLLGTSGKAGVGLLNDPTSMMAVAALAGGWGMGMFDGAMFGEAAAGGAAAGSAGAATEAAWTGGEAAGAGAGAAGAGAAGGAYGGYGSMGASEMAAYPTSGIVGGVPSAAVSGAPGFMDTMKMGMSSLGQGWDAAKPWLKGGASGLQALQGFETMMAGRQRQQQQQQYGRQLQDLMANPGSVTGMPGYEAGMEAVRRSMAAQGYQGSGNMMGALQQQGGQFYQQQLQNLSQLQGSSNGMPSFATGATQFGAGLAGLASF